MNHFYGWLPREEQDRVNRLELFDEYEEWHDKCSHYMLLYAMKGICQDMCGLLPRQSNVGALCVTPLLLHPMNEEVTEESCTFRR